MQPVTLYTKPFCPYCSRAMALLREKGVAFTEIEAAYDPAKKEEMVQRAHGRRTFPQIFIGEQHVGGCDDLVDLDDRGELDRLLQAA